MDESKVRSQDFFTVISYIGGNPVGRGLVWEFVRANWELIVDRYEFLNIYFEKLYIENDVMYR